MNTKELFKHFYIINLERRQDRWERITKELSDQFPSVEPKRFIAIDGSKTGCPDWWMPDRNKLQREGAWGCFRSHLRLIEQAINENWNGLMLWEDDVVLCPDFNDKLEEAVASIQSVFDILYLGGQHVQCDLGEPSVLNDYWVKGYNINRTHAYYISKPYLKTVYDHLLKYGLNCPSQHIDWQLGELCKKPESVFLIPRSPLCYQGGGVSDIGNETNLNTFQHTFNQFPQQIGTEVFDLKLCYSNVGYGQIGINEAGYDNVEIAMNDPDAVYLSAHAPSSIAISSSQKTVVKCRQNDDMSASNQSVCYVDRQLIGTVQEAGSETKEITLEPGIHFLDITTTNKAQAHTVWEVKAAV